MMAFEREDFQVEAGKKLKLFREGAGLTQQDVADALEMPRSTYANIEHGRQRVPADVAWRVALIVGVSADKILPKPKAGSPGEVWGAPAPSRIREQIGESPIERDRNSPPPEVRGEEG